ncbi:D-alanine--D-alanine ligase A [Fulvitalea axinellae]|uniref:D-alanine--D-alanine ligase n=1 Tax=Fulvitalea axinellae TaxID=1182444 RepID=A0AAU9CLQ7_9BACT|nr:D-alanine--D-alanine ligase A [Fulvitalea axinellae]
MSKIKVGILFGGRSVEHEISLRSAANVYKYIDKDQFEVVLVGIDKNGAWHLGLEPGAEFPEKDTELALRLDPEKKVLVSGGKEHRLDLVFPVLHGTDGEDGAVQGLLKAMEIPCVGSGVLGSALCMDKIFSKKMLEAQGLPVAKYLVGQRNNRAGLSFETVKETLGMPVIVKPAVLGSSVGVSKVTDASSWEAALDEAYAYDDRVLVEEFITGRELECAVIGNADPVASAPGEVIITGAHDFYSFDAKYVDKASETKIPADVTASEDAQIRECSVQAYKTLACEDFARVDIFLSEQGKVYVNEINTIPGFTDISMFPALWANEGIDYPSLLTKLINMALERSGAENKSGTHFESSLNRDK